MRYLAAQLCIAIAFAAFAFGYRGAGFLAATIVAALLVIIATWGAASTQQGAK